MTPAIGALETAGVPFTISEYARESDELRDFGREAADALGLSPDEVFKTLLVRLDTAAIVVAVIPVSCQLSMKLVAAAAGAKKAAMCDAVAAERSSGYVVGGISPIGQRRRLATLIDETALLHETIFVSGGRRGLDVGVAPNDLVRLLDATIAPLTA